MITKHACEPEHGQIKEAFANIYDINMKKWILVPVKEAYSIVYDINIKQWIFVPCHLVAIL